jgi:hypothetical protein
MTRRAELTAKQVPVRVESYYSLNLQNLYFIKEGI